MAGAGSLIQPGLGHCRARSCKPSARRSAKNLTADFDCPTGEYPKIKPCAEITATDEIDPFSTAYTRRNKCNRCPKVNPKPLYAPGKIWNKLAGYYDAQGNEWEPDSSCTAPHYHGDAGYVSITPENQTYRIADSLNGGRGWPCIAMVSNGKGCAASRMARSRRLGRGCLSANPVETPQRNNQLGAGKFGVDCPCDHRAPRTAIRFTTRSTGTCAPHCTRTRIPRCYRGRCGHLAMFAQDPICPTARFYAMLAQSAAASS